MGTHKKKNGTITVKGAGGRITHNLPSSALTGPDTNIARIDGAWYSLTPIGSEDPWDGIGECGVCGTTYVKLNPEDHCGDCGSCNRHCYCSDLGGTKINPGSTWEERVQALEDMGMDRSDAQSAVDAEDILGEILGQPDRITLIDASSAVDAGAETADNHRTPISRNALITTIAVGSTWIAEPNYARPDVYPAGERAETRTVASINRDRIIWQREDGSSITTGLGLTDGTELTTDSTGALIVTYANGTEVIFRPVR